MIAQTIMSMPKRSLSMSDTLQNDDYVEEVSETVEINDSNPDSGTGEQVQAESTEQVDEVAAAKQKANEAFNKQYGEKKQLERDLEQQKQRIAQFEQAERDNLAAQVGTVPDMPDAFDDDYDAKLRVRDEAIRANERYNAQNQMHQQQQQHTQQQAAQARQQEVNDSMIAYSNKAVDFGINQNELQAAGNAVAGYGLSEDLIFHILKDSDGPLITKHLAANPQDGYQLATMSPYEVGSFLGDVKKRASALKPKKSSAPNPATNLQGNGADPDAGKYKYSDGATFE